MVHFGPRATPEFDAIRTSLRSTRVRIGALAGALERDHPDWSSGTDARLTSFAKLANVIESAELALKFLDEYMAHAGWWASNYSPLPSSRDAGLYIQEFSQFSKAGLLQLGFGATESSFRVFLRALDPAACEGGTGAFKAVYDCLLRTKLRLAQADDRIALLDLLRELRNSIHNHGVYFHHRKPGAVVIYRGERYEFTGGIAISFATWTLLGTLFAAVAELLAEVVGSPNISGILAPLDEPAF